MHRPNNPHYDGNPRAPNQPPATPRHPQAHPPHHLPTSHTPSHSTNPFLHAQAPTLAFGNFGAGKQTRPNSLTMLQGTPARPPYNQPLAAQTIPHQQHLQRTHNPSTPAPIAHHHPPQQSYAAPIPSTPAPIAAVQYHPNPPTPAAPPATVLTTPPLPTINPPSSTVTATTSTTIQPKPAEPAKAPTYQDFQRMKQQQQQQQQPQHHQPMPNTMLPPHHSLQHRQSQSATNTPNPTATTTTTTTTTNTANITTTPARASKYDPTTYKLQQQVEFLQKQLAEQGQLLNQQGQPQGQGQAATRPNPAPARSHPNARPHLDRARDNDYYGSSQDDHHHSNNDNNNNNNDNNGLPRTALSSQQPQQQIDTSTTNPNLPKKSIYTSTKTNKSNNSLNSLNTQDPTSSDSRTFSSHSGACIFLSSDEEDETDDATLGGSFFPSPHQRQHLPPGNRALHHTQSAPTKFPMNDEPTNLHAHNLHNPQPAPNDPKVLHGGQNNPSRPTPTKPSNYTPKPHQNDVILNQAPQNNNPNRRQSSFQTDQSMCDDFGYFGDFDSGDESEYSLIRKLDRGPLGSQQQQQQQQNGSTSTTTPATLPPASAVKPNIYKRSAGSRAPTPHTTPPTTNLPPTASSLTTPAGAHNEPETAHPAPNTITNIDTNSQTPLHDDDLVKLGSDAVFRSSNTANATASLIANANTEPTTASASTATTTTTTTTTAAKSTKRPLYVRTGPAPTPAFILEEQRLEKLRKEQIAKAQLERAQMREKQNNPSTPARSGHATDGLMMPNPTSFQSNDPSEDPLFALIREAEANAASLPSSTDRNRARAASNLTTPQKRSNRFTLDSDESESPSDFGSSCDDDDGGNETLIETSDDSYGEALGLTPPRNRHRHQTENMTPSKPEPTTGPLKAAQLFKSRYQITLQNTPDKDKDKDNNNNTSGNKDTNNKTTNQAQAPQKPSQPGQNSVLAPPGVAPGKYTLVNGRWVFARPFGHLGKFQNDVEIEAMIGIANNIKQTVNSYHLLHTIATHSLLYPFTRNIAIRDYQQQIVQTCVRHNTLVCLPTGLGKTFIAATTLFNFYRWLPFSKIIFLAPTKPLVSQQALATLSLTPIPHTQTRIMTGETTAPKRKAMWANHRVFFATPQTFLSDLVSLRIDDPKSFSLIIFDEAHRVTKDAHYVRVVKHFTANGLYPRLIGLSATPGGDINSVNHVIENLRSEKIEVRTLNDPNVSKYQHTKTLYPVVIPMGELFGLLETMVIQLATPSARLLYSKNLLANQDPATLSSNAIRQATGQAMSTQKAQLGGQIMTVLAHTHLLVVLVESLRFLRSYSLSMFYHHLKTAFTLPAGPTPAPAGAVYAPKSAATAAAAAATTPAKQRVLTKTAQKSLKYRWLIDKEVTNNIIYQTMMRHCEEALAAAGGSARLWTQRAQLLGVYREFEKAEQDRVAQMQRGLGGFGFKPGGTKASSKAKSGKKAKKGRKDRAMDDGDDDDIDEINSDDDLDSDEGGSDDDDDESAEKTTMLEDGAEADEEDASPAEEKFSKYMNDHSAALLCCPQCGPVCICSTIFTHPKLEVLSDVLCSFFLTSSLDHLLLPNAPSTMTLPSTFTPTKPSTSLFPSDASSSLLLPGQALHTDLVLPPTTQNPQNGQTAPNAPSNYRPPQAHQNTLNTTSMYNGTIFRRMRHSGLHKFLAEADLDGLATNYIQEVATHQQSFSLTGQDYNKPPPPPTTTSTTTTPSQPPPHDDHGLTPMFNTNAKVIIFTTLRSSVGEIFTSLLSLSPLIRPARFIGTAAGKKGEGEEGGEDDDDGEETKSKSTKTGKSPTSATSSSSKTSTTTSTATTGPAKKGNGFNGLGIDDNDDDDDEFADLYDDDGFDPTTDTYNPYGGSSGIPFSQTGASQANSVVTQNLTRLDSMPTPLQERTFTPSNNLNAIGLTGKLTTGMSRDVQHETLRLFKEGVYNVLVCTNIAEEGLDIGEVDLIICYDTTSSPIRQIQRQGRTGRKRDGAVVTLLAQGREQIQYENSIKKINDMFKVLSTAQFSFVKPMFSAYGNIPTPSVPVQVPVSVQSPPPNSTGMDMMTMGMGMGMGTPGRQGFGNLNPSANSAFSAPSYSTYRPTNAPTTTTASNQHHHSAPTGSTHISNILQQLYGPEFVLPRNYNPPIELLDLDQDAEYLAQQQQQQLIFRLAEGALSSTPNGQDAPPIKSTGLGYTALVHELMGKVTRESKKREKELKDLAKKHEQEAKQRQRAAELEEKKQQRQLAKEQEKQRKAEEKLNGSLSKGLVDKMRNELPSRSKSSSKSTPTKSTSSTSSSSRRARADYDDSEDDLFSDSPPSDGSDADSDSDSDIVFELASTAMAKHDKLRQAEEKEAAKKAAAERKAKAAAAKQAKPTPPAKTTKATSSTTSSAKAKAAKPTKADKPTTSTSKTSSAKSKSDSKDAPAKDKKDKKSSKSDKKDKKDKKSDKKSKKDKKDKKDKKSSKKDKSSSSRRRIHDSSDSDEPDNDDDHDEHDNAPPITFTEYNSEEFWDIFPVQPGKSVKVDAMYIGDSDADFAHSGNMGDDDDSEGDDCENDDGDDEDDDDYGSDDDYDYVEEEEDVNPFLMRSANPMFSAFSNCILPTATPPKRKSAQPAQQADDSQDDDIVDVTPNRGAQPLSSVKKQRRD